MGQIYIYFKLYVFYNYDSLNILKNISTLKFTETNKKKKNRSLYRRLKYLKIWSSASVFKYSKNLN